MLVDFNARRQLVDLVVEAGAMLVEVFSKLPFLLAPFPHQQTPFAARERRLHIELCAGHARVIQSLLLELMLLPRVEIAEGVAQFPCVSRVWDVVQVSDGRAVCVRVSLFRTTSVG